MPIALGILSATGALRQPEKLASYIVLGELALDGRITPVSGVLAAMLNARKLHKGVVCPHGNMTEAKLVCDIPVLGPKHLSSLVEYFNEVEGAAYLLTLIYLSMRSRMLVAVLPRLCLTCKMCGGICGKACYGDCSCWGP